MPVPRPGAYRVSLRAQMRSGQTVELEKRFSFRDVLLVSIGDLLLLGAG